MLQQRVKDCSHDLVCPLKLSAMDAARKLGAASVRFNRPGIGDDVWSHAFGWNIDPFIRNL